MLNKQAIPLLVGGIHTQTKVCYYVYNSLGSLGRSEAGVEKEKVSQEQEPNSHERSREERTLGKRAEGSKGTELLQGTSARKSSESMEEMQRS